MKIPQLPRGYNALTLYPTSETRSTIAPLRSDLGPDPQKGVMAGAVFLRALSAFPLPPLPPPTWPERECLLTWTTSRPSIVGGTL